MNDELQNVILGLIPEGGCDEATLTAIFERVFRNTNTLAHQRIPSVRDLAGKTKLGHNLIYALVNRYKLAGKLTVRPGLGTFISPQFNAFGLGSNPFVAADAQSIGIRTVEAPRPAIFWQCGNDVPDPNWLNRRIFPELVRKNSGAIAFAKNAKWISYYRSEALTALLAGDLLSNRGFLFDPANFCLRYGQLVTQLQLAQLLLKPGDTLVTTMRHHHVLNSLLVDRGIMVRVADPADEHGLLSLVEGLARNGQLQLIHVHPRASLLGKRMSAPLMQDLIDLALAHRIWLLEEDTAHEFYFAADEFRPLAAHKHGGQVIHLRPVSLLDPDFGHLWQVIALDQLVDGLNRLPDQVLLYANLAKEQALEEMLRTNKWVLSVQHAREQALKNRDDMYGLFEYCLADHASIVLPDAGLNMTVKPHERQHMAVYARYLSAHPNPINGQYTGSDPMPAMQVLRMGFGRYDHKETAGQLKGLMEALNRYT